MPLLNPNRHIFNAFLVIFDWSCYMLLFRNFINEVLLFFPFFGKGRRSFTKRYPHWRFEENLWTRQCMKKKTLMWWDTNCLYFKISLIHRKMEKHWITNQSNNHAFKYLALVFKNEFQICQKVLHCLAVRTFFGIILK